MNCENSIRPNEAKSMLIRKRVDGEHRCRERNRVTDQSQVKQRVMTHATLTRARNSKRDLEKFFCSLLHDRKVNNLISRLPMRSRPIIHPLNTEFIAIFFITARKLRRNPLKFAHSVCVLNQQAINCARQA